MLAADIAVFWEQDRLDAFHLPSTGAEYVIGEAAGCHHVAPGLMRHGLVRVADDAVIVTEPGTGRMHRLGLGEHMTVGVGTLAFGVTAVRREASGLPPGTSKKRDPMGPHLLVAGILHLMCAAVLVSLPRDVSSLDFDGFAETRAAMSFLSLPEASVEPEVPVEADVPVKAASSTDGAAPARPRSTADAQANPRPSADPRGNAVAAVRAKQVAADAAASLTRALDAGLGDAGDLSSVLGRSGADAWSRLEAGTGAPAGLGDAWGGAGPRGLRGAGGLGAGLDVGPMATRGGGDDVPRSSGGYGRLGQRKPKIIADTFGGGPVVSDGLDLETVRRVIRQHVAEYRACYERQLNLKHDLEGKVTVKFVIGGTGDVIAVSVDEDTSGDPALGACLTERVRRWGFPTPAGGGRVVVRYPFVFRTSGATSGR